MASTMFERYGGFATVSKIVSAFYDKVLDSSILAPYFDRPVNFFRFMRPTEIGLIVLGVVASIGLLCTAGHRRTASMVRRWLKISSNRRAPAALGSASNCAGPNPYCSTYQGGAAGYQ